MDAIQVVQTEMPEASDWKNPFEPVPVFVASFHDISMSSDFQASDAWINIQKRCIFNAINAVYPSAVAKIYRGAEDRRPSMPQLDILSCTRTEHLTLGSILENEATKTGTYRVLENIFLKQLGLDEQSAFQDRLYLVYGDQKTCNLIRLCQNQRSESSETYYRLEQVLQRISRGYLFQQNILSGPGEARTS
ncbi:uncharacterized protein N7515_002512 [Penicillium bovifimosum]|uniref:DUF6589 domain-containing protein n=1 Tax=Penicillium bovifimosum TaxID=126998 RepID=A0A9W9HCD9_9EURO|nr:uncharacterized protein N7515_002512 [Penicillium bovifimosum]KAJ5143725.1 hypothetical protein N7515_002512 [Penicillium bovifimosum]